MQNMKTDINQIPTLKLVIYGGGNAGKTSLLSLYSLIKKMYQPQEILSNVTKIQNPFQETALFDQTVFSLGRKTEDIPLVKYIIYTVAGQERYADARKLVLNGCDGLIMLLNPQIDAQDENYRSLVELKNFLGDAFLHTPIIFAINKRDLPNSNQTPIDEILSLVVTTGFVPDLATLKSRHIYMISTLAARNDLLSLLQSKDPEIFDEKQVLKKEFIPDTVKAIILMIHDLTKQVITSKINLT